MSKRRNPTVTAPQSLILPRRSPRFFRQPVSTAEDPSYPTRKVKSCSGKLDESFNGSPKTPKSSTGVCERRSLRRSLRLSCQKTEKRKTLSPECVNGSSSLRRSLRVCNKVVNGVDETRSVRRYSRLFKVETEKRKGISAKFDNVGVRSLRVRLCGKAFDGVEETPSVRRSSRLSIQETEKRKEISEKFDKAVDGSLSGRQCSKAVNKKLENNKVEAGEFAKLDKNGIGKDVSKKKNWHEKSKKSVERASGVSEEGIVCALRCGARAEVRGNMVRDAAAATKEEKGIERKRKREEGSKGCAAGWSKEQELALQRAYFTAKPTPLFWKKVAKLVPGKSAKDCFDRIHADQLTPRLPRPKSRAKLSSSPCGLISASKLLQPTEAKPKKSGCYKHKSHLVRELLKKVSRVDQDSQVDLFSVLESENNPSNESNQLDSIFFTPKQAKGRKGFLEMFNERSTSSSKKPLSRFSGSFATTLESPPVLKPVKNMVLHEKYIDQLHCREAKRKAASARVGKSFPGKENRKDINAQVVDTVNAAKCALASVARDAINQLQHKQYDSPGNSSEYGDNAVDSDDEAELI